MAVAVPSGSRRITGLTRTQTQRFCLAQIHASDTPTLQPVRAATTKSVERCRRLIRQREYRQARSTIFSDGSPREVSRLPATTLQRRSAVVLVELDDARRVF